MRKAYQSDLSDAQWSCLEGHLPAPNAPGRPRLYPLREILDALLRRLQREGKVEGSWQESVAGPPRKYYHLTPQGRDLLRRMAADWVELNEAVQQTLPTEEAKSQG